MHCADRPRQSAQTLLGIALAKDFALLHDASIDDRVWRRRGQWFRARE